MSIAVTRTKIHLPRRRSDLLSRERLLGLLDDLLDYRLTLVAAPAGYGKTSLLVDIAHQVEYPFCWYALDTLDEDFQRFLIHFIASIQHCFPEFGGNSMSVVQSMSLENLDIDQLVAMIVNDAYENISEHFVIVLDDYHLIDDSEIINRFISLFGQEVDENCHLVIASRTLLSLPDLPLMVGRSQVKGLSFDELAFQPKEIKALLQQNYHQSITEDEAQGLADKTEGWITGLLLSAETMWKGMNDRVRVARVSGVDLYDYLAQQVLDQQLPIMREFLLRTSLLEEFDVQLCQAVLGDAPERENWPDLLVTLLQKNLFVQPVENGGTWLRYHHLFRDFLQTQLVKEDPETEKWILRKLVEVYSEREEWEKAYATCQRLEDDEVTVWFVKQVGFEVGKAGRVSTLAKWIDNLVGDYLTDDPELLSLRGGAAVMLGEVEKGFSLLDEAILLFTETENITGHARALVWRATAYRLMGNYQDSLADSEAVLNMTEEKPNFILFRAESLRAKGGALHSLGLSIRATKPLKQSIQAYQFLEDDKNAALVHLDLGLVNMQIGRYNTALEHYENSLAVWRKTNNTTRQANLYNNLGVLAHLKGELIQAKTFLLEALEHSDKSGYTRIKAFALSGLGDILSDLDLYKEAGERYLESKGAAEKSEEQYLLFYIDLVEAGLLRKSGEIAKARRKLGKVERIVNESGSSYERGLWQLECGQISLVQDEYKKASHDFNAAMENFQSGGQQIERVRAGLYLAYTKNLLGEKDYGRLHLVEVFQHVNNLESLYPLVSTAREMKEFLKEAKTFPEVRKPVSRLMEGIVRFEEELPQLRRQFSPSEDSAGVPPLALEIKAFGRGQVKVQGEPVIKPEWINQKTVRELFFFLLTQPNGLSKEVIGHTLWPESSPEQLKTQFKNAVYRLRRALGKETILYDDQQKRYYFNWDLSYSYDIEEFQSYLDQAQQASQTSERLNRLQKALDIYTNLYLLGMDGFWAEPLRASYFQDFKKGALVAAELYLDFEKGEQVIQVCQNLLAVEPSQEIAHRFIMRAYAAQGDRVGVARQYQRCQQSLKRELDLSPSSETEELYQRLMN